jgi:hypothetical protein
MSAAAPALQHMQLKYAVGGKTMCPKCDVVMINNLTMEGTLFVCSHCKLQFYLDRK